MFLIIATSSGVGADTTVITTAHLTLIAILAVLTVLGILWGARQKRIRERAAHESEERAAEVQAHENKATADPKADVPAAKDAPAPKAAAPSAPAGSSNYRLCDVKGLGPKAATQLEALGVADLPALAALSPERAAELDGQLGALSGRMARDQWVEQAQLLAAGDVAGFEQTYGKL